MLGVWKFYSILFLGFLYFLSFFLTPYKIPRFRGWFCYVVCTFNCVCVILDKISFLNTYHSLFFRFLPRPMTLRLLSYTFIYYPFLDVLSFP
ncbi:hypothetical protein BZA77DRAFT_326477 [Pyronema omphalodes]|nr:hypothetical protein BZA77DRAFT_326477 [Pyronema omphalodes]